MEAWPKVGSWKVGLKLYCGDEQQTAGVRLVRSEPEGAAMSSRILMSACRLATTGSPVWSKELPVEVTEMARWRKIGWKLADQREKTWCLSLVLLTTPTPQRPNTRLQVASPLVTNCATPRLYNWWDGRGQLARSAELWLGRSATWRRAGGGLAFCCCLHTFWLAGKLSTVCLSPGVPWVNGGVGKSTRQGNGAVLHCFSGHAGPTQCRGSCAAAGRGGLGGLGEGSRTGFAWHWSG